MLAVALASACGDDAIEEPDGGATENVRLVVLGQVSIGLAPTETRTLRVRYETESGAPIGDGEIVWSFLAGDGEDPGGSTLSAASTFTDDDGAASIELTAGLDEVSFRVVAEAARAPRATFYAAVSAGGFIQLEVLPAHQGFRPVDDFDRVEVRLYRAVSGPCTELRAAAAAGAPLESPFPPMTMTGFGDTIRFENLAVADDYTLLGWGTAGNELVVSLGCAELAAAQIPPGPAEVELAIADRAPALPVQLAIESVVELAPVAAAVTAAGGDAPWHALACPAGPGQLALDCLVDALADDGALDCATEAGSLDGVAAEMDAARGDLGEDGCRMATDVEGDPTLDGLLALAIELGGFPGEADRTAIRDVRAAILAQMMVHSRLDRVAAGVLEHHLQAVAFEAGAISASFSLEASSLPVVTASASSTIGSDGVAVIGAHAFTLRLGRWAAAALRELALDPLGLSGTSDSLGTAQLASADDGEGRLGCAAISAVACAAAEAPLGCALDACATAALALDEQLRAGWLLLDGAALDLRLAGEVGVSDDDADLVADAMKATDPPGVWTAKLTLADGAEIPTIGIFAAPIDLP